jgi:hypothetical protein
MGRVGRALAALLVGFLTFLVLFPFAGNDSDPPQYFSVFGNRVPTGGPWLAIGFGVGVAVLMWLQPWPRGAERGVSR